MARYKPYDLRQGKMIPLSCADQISPGSFEYALDDIVERHLDLSVFDKRCRNDHSGRFFSARVVAIATRARWCGVYLRQTVVRKDGRAHRYWRLVRSVRHGRKVVQETVAHLGELDGEGRARARLLAR